MLEIKEFLDIEKIENIRVRSLNKKLDEHDNFSYHIALVEKDKIYGVARLYKQNLDLVIDCVACESFSNECHLEMLFRALLLKAQNIECRYVIAILEHDLNFYKKFNFDNDLKAKPVDLVFPKMCKNCENKTENCEETK